MYNSKLYEIDTDRQDSNAALKEGAVLYRIASLDHWRARHIISGEGAMRSGEEGRFHRVDQRASYCANNVLVCVAEMLYHRYRRFLEQLDGTQPEVHADIWTTQRARLAIFPVQEIDNMIYVDTMGAKTFDPRITSTTIVFPDSVYGPLHGMSDHLRQKKKSGVVYPSARHSKDFAIAFFRNETQKVKKEVFYKAPLITLQLIPEDQDTISFPPRRFKAYTDVLHATMGYYEFKDRNLFERLKSEGWIYPSDIPAAGYVDFVRRHYGNGNYPGHAVRR